MSYYKYAERDESVQVNWADIGKNLSQTFQDINTERETKKAAIDANTRKLSQDLNSSPQGEFQGGNNLMNNFVASAQQSRLLDDKLLKSGGMDLKTYTLRRQNLVDSTNTITDLQKTFQEAYKPIMEGLNSQPPKYSPQVAYEMMKIQGFGDFNDSMAVIDPYSSNVSLAKTKIVNGIKEIIPNSSQPVNVIKGKLMSPPPIYDVNAATKSLVDSQGDLVLSLYKAGSLSGAGTITELTGLAAIEKFADKEWTEAAKSLNSAINQAIDGMLQQPRAMADILTTKIPGYDAFSYTYDKEEAKKDPKKILLKATPQGGYGEEDKNGPNYEAQKKQVADWITTSIKSQMDAKVAIKETSQVQLQEKRAPTQTEVDLNTQREMSKNLAQNLVYSLTGDTNKSAAGTKYLSATTTLPIDKTKEGFVVQGDNGTQVFKFRADGKTLSDPLGFAKSFVGVMKGKMPDINETQVLQYVQQFLPKGAKINELTEAKGFESQPKKVVADPLKVYSENIDRFIPRISKNDADKAFGSSLTKLNNSLNAIGASAEKPSFIGISNPYSKKIIITAPNGVVSSEIDLMSDNANQTIKLFIKANPKGVDANAQGEWAENLNKLGVFTPAKKPVKKQILPGGKVR